MKDEASEKLRGMLDRMGVEGEVEATEDEERVVLEIKGAESGLVIGKHGATLDALQYLVNKMVARSDDEGGKPVVVDAEGYRERRAEALTELAKRLAEKALRTGRPVAAAPMSPADRRVMHLALANEPGITTQSEGEGAARHLMIIPGERAAGGGRSSQRSGSGA
jgi:spoIIIJ-associated protein